MSPRGRQIQRSETSMAKALEAALSLFSSKGYGATSMREISEASDLSVGNLYHHFGSKEAILQRLLDDYFERLLDPRSELNRSSPRPTFRPTWSSWPRPLKTRSATTPSSSC
jgi:AcrR family transcriptional regulator